MGREILFFLVVNWELDWDFSIRAGQFLFFKIEIWLTFGRFLFSDFDFRYLKMNFKYLDRDLLKLHLGFNFLHLEMGISNFRKLH